MNEPILGTASADGHFYWDGIRWGSTLSPDGRWRWNGVAWVAIAQSPTELRPSTSYRSPRTLAVWVSVLLGICIAVSAIEALVVRFYIAETLAYGDVQVDYSIGIAGFLMFVITASLFVPWFWRACQNLAALGGQDLQFTSGWAIGWWFIPIACFWMPYRAAIEIWKASDPLAARATSADSRRQVGTSSLIRLWWAAWLASVVLSNVAAVAVAPDRNGLIPLAAVSGATTILAAALSIWVVRSVTKRQTERYDLLVRLLSVDREQ